MPKKMCLLFFISWVTVLVSCTTLYADPPFTSNQSNVSKVYNWKVKGSIGISHNGRTDMASLNWVQIGKQNYIITLTGPLSMGATRIAGTSGHVVLWKSKKERYTARSPEQLMQSRLGWQIPLSNMFYWAQGLPAPHIRAKSSYDEEHRLSHLTQQGWEIQYLEYTTVDGIDLPQKMVLMYPDLQIKLVIKQWRI